VRAFSSRKEQLLNTLLKWMVALGAVAYVPSLLACINDNLYVLAVIDTLAYLILVIVFFYPRTTYRVRLFTAVLITLALGTAVLFRTGTEGAGHIWLICAAFIAALFGQRSFTIVIIALTQVAVIVYSILNIMGIIDHDISLMSIIAIGANMLLISITLALITYHLLKSLQQEISGQEETLKLLDHRVRNNLQSIESLINFETSHSGDDDRLSRRVRALSAANSLLLQNPSEPQVELHELLRLISDPTAVKISGNREVSISPEEMTEVVVGFSDLFELLHDVAPLFVFIENTITIKSSHPLPDSDELRDRLKESLTPPHWIDVTSTTGSRDEIRINAL
jgi:hypothetical protein